MKFKAHRKQFLLAGPLVAAVTAVTITACGGGSAPAFAQGSAPGHWTQAEINEIAAAAGSDGGGSNSCFVTYFARDMSFGNAMAVGSVVSSDSTADPKAALVAKYGTSEGDAIYGQYQQVVSDVASNCPD